MEPSLPSILPRGALDRLVRAFAPERIVLFGSYAKGTSRPDSDIDLLVIASLEGDLRTHLRRARQLVADLFPVVDVVLCTPDDLDEDTPRSTFLRSALGHGIVVY